MILPALSRWARSWKIWQNLEKNRPASRSKTRLNLERLEDRELMASDLLVEINAAPNFIVDSNLKSGPTAAYLTAKVTNTGTDTLNNVFLYMGNYIDGANDTPGTYPVRVNPPGFTGSLSLQHEGGQGDAVRFLGTLAPGQTVNQYWLVSYPWYDALGNSTYGAHANNNDDLVLSYDVWAKANDPVDGAVTTVTTSNVTMREEISAMANKIWPNTTSKVPQQYLDAIQEQLGWRPNINSTTTARHEGIWYDMGRVNQGFDADGNLIPDYDVWMQPVGNPTIYDASAWRVVHTYGVLIVKLNDGTEKILAFEDQLYHKDLPANNTGVVGLVFYEFAAIGSGQGQLSPYQEAASGSNNEKFNGDYGISLGGPTLTSPQITFDKNGPANAVLNSAVTYSLTVSNTGTTTFGLGTYGLPVVISDAVPGGTQYITGSAAATSLPAGTTVRILYSTDNGLNWNVIEPANPALVTNIQWWLSAPLSAGTSGAVQFQTTVPVSYTAPKIVNEGGVGLGNNPPLVTDTVNTLVLGTHTLGGLVFRDDGASGGTAGDGQRNGGEGTLGNINVTLYLDTNGDGKLDAGDQVRATTTSLVANGSFSFSNLSNGQYVVAVLRTDADLPTGWQLSTVETYPITINNADQSGFQFGFSPAVEVNKTLVGSSPVNEGNQVSYTIDVTNLLKNNSSSSNVATVNDLWLANATGTFTNPGDAAGAPNSSFATAVNNAQNLVGSDPIQPASPQGNVVNVQALLRFQGSSVLDSDETLTLVVTRQGTNVGTITLTGAEVNPFVSSSGLVAVNVTSLAAWTWADFQATNTGLTVTYNESGTSPTVSIDALGFRVTSGANTSSGGITWSDATTAVKLAPAVGGSLEVFLRSLPASPTDVAYDASAGKVYLAYSSTGIIEVRNLDGSSAQSPINVGGTISGLDIDPVNGFIYWSDRGVGIKRATLAGTGITTIVSSSNNPEGVAVDVAGGQVYWLESVSRRARILRANLDGTNSVLIVDSDLGNTGNSSPRDIELDLVHGKIYWTDDNSGNGNEYVGVANFDGTNLQKLISLPTGSDPRGLALDPSAGLIYWADNGGIKKANLDGSNILTFMPNLTSLQEVEILGAGSASLGTFDVDRTLSIVPLLDDYDPSKLKFISASLQPTSIDQNTGLLSWSNVGPINPGITRTITVTFEALEPSGNSIDSNVQNTATVNNPVVANGLTANSATDTVTMTVNPTAVLGSYVWSNKNGNSLKEAGEPGIPGVTVQLRDSTGTTILQSTVTDVTGNYQFKGVTAGTYLVVIDTTTLPTGATNNFDPDAATANRSTVTITDPVGVVGPADNLTQNFGYDIPNVFFGVIWRDFNNDGLRSSTETGISGVTVQLVNTSNVVVTTTTTNGDGTYRFLDVADGSYQVRVATGTLPSIGTWNQTADPDSTQDSQTPTGSSQAVNNGDVSGSHDFGYHLQGTASIGNEVFFDWNQDNIKDAQDEGIPNFTVSLYMDLNANGVLDPSIDPLITTTSTNAGGIYNFMNLPGGRYLVLVDEGDADFPGNLTRSTTNPTVVLLYAGANRTNVDFGYNPYGSGTFSGTVWFDQNGNQAQAGGNELGLANITVTLQADLNNDGTFQQIATTATSANGGYLFANLPLGTYRAVVDSNDPDLPEDVYGTTYDPSTATQFNRSISQANPNASANFGFGTLGTIGDFVFYDANRNGTQDWQETGIPNVTVQLLDSGNNVVATTVTSAGGAGNPPVGFYLFTGIATGTYTVQVNTATLPAGITGANLIADPDRDGVPSWDNTYPGLSAADNRDADVSVTFGVNYAGADFGYQPRGVVGDYIWRDLNSNGIQDSGEIGLVNVAVSITNGLITLNTTTDFDGLYTFQGLTPGTWTITVTPPGGMTASSSGNITDLLNGNGSIGANSASLTINSSGQLTHVNGTLITDGDLKIDFGYRFPGTNSLTGAVVLEQNGSTDGNAGEATDLSVQGVTVFLYDNANNLLGSTLTNASGIYTFPGLPAGVYQVTMLANSPVLANTVLTTQTGNTPASSVIVTGNSAKQVINVTAPVTGLDFAWVSTVNYDLGDLPDSYNTSLVRDGARHIVSGIPTLYLGNTPPDTEANSSPGASATSDNLTGTNDENGVTALNPTSWVNGAGGGSVQVVVQGTGWLVAWIDFDNDGDFLGSNEMVINQAFSTGTHTIAINIPSGSLNGSGTQLNSRFRLFAAQPLVPQFAYLGVANGGEVEDYVLQIGSTLASIGNDLWVDVNGNGTLDVTEPPLVGVRVYLDLNNDGVLDANEPRALTNSTGKYLLSNLNAGTYAVRVDTSTLPAGLIPSYDLDGLSSAHVAGVSLTSGQNRTDVDFGYQGSGSITSRVWFDQNINTIRNVNETGLSGVAVNLVWAGPDGNFSTTVDNFILSTNTGADGLYTFSNLPAGNYQISVASGTLPASIVTQTYDLDGLGTANTALTTLTSGQNRTGVDFGYRGSASLGNQVWFDHNNNGTQDASEPGLGGVTINLTWAGQDGNFNTTTNNFTATTTTGADGTYSFGNLASGNYRITVDNATLPNGITSPTFDLDGTVTPHAVEIANLSTSRTDVDFGYRGNLSLNGKVWYDANANATQDTGEPGLGGVGVSLTWAGQDNILGNTDDLTFPVANTASSGAYGFSNLPSGAFRVNVSSGLPTGMGPWVDPDGILTPGQATLTGVSSNTTNVDFGYNGTNSLSGFVYQDTNNNGSYDSVTEVVISGVQIRVTGTDDLGVNINRIVATSSSGAWSLGNLRPGTYTINETQPAGYADGLDAAGTPFGGTPGALETDAIANVLIPSGANNVSGINYNFGEKPLAQLSGYVFLDVNNDGVFNGSDTSIQGAVLTLTGTDYLGNSVNLQAVTTANGVFRFLGLQSSNASGYTLTETQPTLYKDGLDTPGTGASVAGTQTQNGNPDVISSIGLLGTSNAINYYFGEQGVSLSGRVFLDKNASGILDATEPGISGVPLTLLDQNGQVVAIASTLSDGSYVFNNLPTGTYSLVQTQPNGYGSSTPNILTNLVVTSAGLSSQNFGETMGSLAGMVHLTGANPTGISGVTISLTGVDVNGLAINRSTISLADGTYLFTDLLAGTYTLTETQPAGFADGPDQAGTPANGNLVSPDSIVSISLAPGANLIGYNFGEQGAIVGGTVFVDINENGLRDAGEPGIPGVSVTLLNGNGNVVDVLFTNADGVYLFSDLSAGSYNLVESQPSGFGSSTPNTLPIVLTSSGLSEQNFGEITSRSNLAGIVFVDLNNDGLRQAGEPGIAGVNLTLTGVSANGIALNRSVTTEADGSYLFTDLPASNASGYTLTQTQPAGFTDGQDRAGSVGGTALNDVINDIVLQPSTLATGYTFGERGATLTGTVFIDVSTNGVREPGESSGVGNVTITVLDSNGNVVAVGTSANDGTYSFPNLPPGNYTVIESQPTEFGSSTPNTVFINLPPTGLTLDFGETQTSSLAGFVYVDLNQNGLRDAGEQGLAGVTLSLTGPVNQTVVTALDGSYLFTGLVSGVYSITETQPGGFNDGPDSVGTTGGTLSSVDTIDLINLGTRASAIGYNFAERGLTGTGTLLGKAFLDNNGNGVQDADDPGLSGVVLTLQDSNGLVLTTTTSGPDGFYAFPNLSPGTYRVEETQPNGYGSSTANLLTNITLPADGTTTANFGDTLGTLSGLVFGDLNNDGLFNGADFGLDGIALTLTGTDANGQAISRTALTNAAGNYSFGGLWAGTYQVTESPVPGYFDGQDSRNQVVLPGSVGTDVVPNIALVAGGIAANNNFGEVPPADPLGHVYIDENSNGIRDAGEPGIANVLITLTGLDVFGNQVLQTTTTDASGFYQFAGLVPGMYSLRETQPIVSGSNPPMLFLDGQEQNGTPPAQTVTNDFFQNIDLTQAPFFGGGYNFGELLPSSLSGFVYVDANRNGIREINEPGIAGVSILLSGVNDLGQNVTASVVTDIAGNFSFQRMRSGTYQLREVQPRQFFDGQDNPGTGAVNPGTASNDILAGIVLGQNQGGTDFRFGERGLRPQYVSKRRFLTTSTGAFSAGTPGSGIAQIKSPQDADPSGYVYIDRNRNGRKDAKEVGIAGVQIVLTGVTNSGQSFSLSTLTDKNGFYQFDLLPPGIYELTETQPVRYLDGQETLGNLGGLVFNDRFTQIILHAGEIGVGYNFGEWLPLRRSK